MKLWRNDNANEARGQDCSLHVANQENIRKKHCDTNKLYKFRYTELRAFAPIGMLEYRDNGFWDGAVLD
jgi:hypothetical protein